MKSILILSIFSFFFLVSCKQPKLEVLVPETEQPNLKPDTLAAAAVETFNTIEAAAVDALNKTIMAKKLSKNEDIMNAYAPKSNETEGNYTYTVTENKVDENTREITLVEDGLLDDSKAGRKLVMTVDKTNKVLSIKENHKCYAGRGHETWGTENCK
jgi:hypothetical protein